MIRVLIADDECLVRASLQRLLDPVGDVEVVAHARDGREAVSAVTRHRIDVALLDIRMPVMDGLAAAEEIRGLARAPAVIMLTTFDLDAYVHQALRAGAAGFLLKDADPGDIAAALRTVAAGDAMLAPSVTRRLIGEFTGERQEKAAAARERLAVLTERETEVVAAVAQGLSNAEAGRRLAVSEATVKVHLGRALAKLELGNRVQAAILAHDAGLVS